MKKYFDYMEKIGWGEENTNMRELKFDYKILENYYIKESEKENDSDEICCLGFILDFVKAVMEVEK